MMFLRILLLLFAVLPMAGEVEAGMWDAFTDHVNRSHALPPPMIRILIAHDKPGVTLEVKGKYHIFDPHLKEHISTRFIGKRKFIQSIDGGLKWGEEFPGTHQIKIVPDKETTTLIDGVEYHGAIYVYDIGGSISIVNEIFVEDYLDAILAAKSAEGMPEEVQAAIAIADRTKAYYQVFNPKNRFWDVDGEKVGYRGYVQKQQRTGLLEALRATRYMVMAHKAEGVGDFSPFPAQWGEKEKDSKGSVVASRISVEQAVEMAKKGDHAAQILTKAFPGIAIQFIQHASTQKKD